MDESGSLHQDCAWHHPDDAEALNDPLFAALEREANEVAIQLRGDRVYSGPSLGYPMKPLTGHCRLCGEWRKLTYEHIPPRSSGNREPRRVVSAFEVLKATTITEFPTTGSKIQQRGSGFYVLCAECNQALSHLGYVEEYRQFVSVCARNRCSISAGAFLTRRCSRPMFDYKSSGCARDR